jgi:hypothetical protein
VDDDSGKIEEVARNLGWMFLRRSMAGQQSYHDSVYVLILFSGIYPGREN